MFVPHWQEIDGEESVNLTYRSIFYYAKLQIIEQTAK